ncbi:hypothetical protein A2631_05595 [Candidatus Daviesbacteria bacterium RIFCSPHIGHO2_01_FULL_44_29]|uniref:Uncharacterized protein n=1 Tax=Candidatus Daviesbacteria bacterium RIFCSPHIGHO2_02_FULL_43_12 TaxID=1797776 RepID=A0A1F5KI66_9BACT|nr:MAG: hypothetical protein A2631_05595 [Candidatus Daviesbacteria bacterium RIFCSPHIGHO2_01_FULL_44_29]OGE39219.1 MAG: hypothetical protein A3E86_01340 [Candidatus Daviesbacteria bacterium RIFCSPHIGHO2_12_FULL_47_45]OGE40578.1 MAG: hypothetical protein A3D25_00470 [Candidatus Daviesbacteria bacterium RIFCSPHIGHO2_02_FULL_43_12]OGE70138.1 MAG: hypothetical protein A3B55_00240 [Candidatus Daviesbacteria bacterium RIFCSPLOWO2_01_FULL_43_15]
MSDSQSPAEKALNFISRKSEDAKWQIAAENVFGRQVRNYIGLTEGEKREQWLKDGGNDFSGEVGDVRMYAVGIPAVAKEEILQKGLDPSKRTEKGGRLFGGLVKGAKGEGSGIYGTTNPYLASREYGRSIAIIQVATGKEAHIDADVLSRLLYRLRAPVEWSVLATAAVIATSSIQGLFVGAKQDSSLDLLAASSLFSLEAFEVLQEKLFNQLYKRTNPDTVRLDQNVLRTIWQTLNNEKDRKNPMMVANSFHRHEHWLLIRNKNRAKVLGIVDEPSEAVKLFSSRQSFAPSAQSHLFK